MTARAALALALTLATVRGAAAQRFVIGLEAAAGSYQEQGQSLDFSGWGPALSVAGSWRRYGIVLNVTRIAFSPTDSAAAAEPFDLAQFDGRVRWDANATWGLEAGYLQRTISPSTAAQGMSVIPVGGRVNFPLAPGARIAAHADYLAAAKFSGGGSASVAIEVGLGASYAPGAGTVRFTADFAFDRLDRQTSSGGSTLEVPIQSSVGTLGIALVF